MFFIIHTIAAGTILRKHRKNQSKPLQVHDGLRTGLEYRLWPHGVKRVASSKNHGTERHGELGPGHRLSTFFLVAICAERQIKEPQYHKFGIASIKTMPSVAKLPPLVKLLRWFSWFQSEIFVQVRELLQQSKILMMELKRGCKIFKLIAQVQVRYFRFNNVCFSNHTWEIVSS